MRKQHQKGRRPYEITPMKITINEIFALNELGQRENNEDSILPSKENVTTNERLFIVCDGVGGLNKGEVASELASKAFKHGLELKRKEYKTEVSTEDVINDGFEHMQATIDSYIEENPEVRGMGTTLVAVDLHEQGLSVAHCGDSRFYHIREGKILWQTEDHSVLNELLKHGVITPEEAKESRNNKISRAIQGNLVKETEADIHFISDVAADDFLFLCSDGVSGSISDDELTDILSGVETTEEKMQTIETLCEANSKDNYSAFLIRIDAVEKTTEELAAIPVVEAETPPAAIIDEPEKATITPKDETEKSNEAVETDIEQKEEMGSVFDKYKIPILATAGVLVVVLVFLLLPSRGTSAVDKLLLQDSLLQSGDSSAKYGSRLELYQAFVEKYSDNEFAANAQDSIWAIMLYKAKREDNKAAYVSFIDSLKITKNHKKIIYFKEAVDSISSKTMHQLRKKNTLKGYEGFAQHLTTQNPNNYQTNKYYIELQDSIAAIKYREVKTINTRAAYEVFFKEYPLRYKAEKDSLLKMFGEPDSVPITNEIDTINIK